MQKKYLIRKFQAQDQQQVRELYRNTVAANPELYYRPLSESQLPDDVMGNFSGENDAFFVAVADQKIIGMCAIRRDPQDPDWMTLVNGCVDPDFRGQGVYLDLCAARLEHAAAKGLKKFLARTSAKNLKMLAYLEEQGFERFESASAKAGFVDLKLLRSE